MPIEPRAVFQPDRRLIESCTHPDQSDSSDIVRASGEVILYKGIPYSRYQGRWQFHPNRIGRYLVATRAIAEAVNTALRLRAFLTELPNGGLALYYPRTITTARFQTPEFVYSGIAQGQLLAGYTRLIAEGSREHQAEWRETAERLVLALQFPLELGGVCADDKVILEAPNFRSCPEAILNGWMDALLHLYDYLVVVRQPSLVGFYRGSLRALTELLPYFDDPQHRLSRYSNLCPYVFRGHMAARLPSGRLPAIRIEYLSRIAGYSDRWAEDLRRTGRGGCLYDNAINKVQGRHFDFSVSISGHYDVRIEIGGNCRNLSFDPGGWDEKSTVPHRTFLRRSISPAVPYNGKITSFFLRPREMGLLVGCPTEFTKYGGLNFYHSYHVAALYQLALTTQDSREREVLVGFANRWLSYMTGPFRPRLGLKFADPETVLKTIDRSRALPLGRTLNELQAMLDGRANTSIPGSFDRDLLLGVPNPVGGGRGW